MKVGAEQLTAKEHLSGGLVAGAFSAVLTSPIDAVKTRMQVCIWTVFTDVIYDGCVKLISLYSQ